METNGTLLDEDEPRQGVPSGSIPGAVSLPFTELLCESTGHKEQAQTVFLPRPQEELRELFASRGVIVENKGQKIAAMCGSGITACVLALLLHHVLGRTDVAVYDGSWHVSQILLLLCRDACCSQASSPPDKDGMGLVVAPEATSATACSRSWTPSQVPPLTTMFWSANFIHCNGQSKLLMTGGDQHSCSYVFFIMSCICCQSTLRKSAEASV